MPESVLLCAIGFLLIAATTHRFRRESGMTVPRARMIARVFASVLIVAALVNCGTALDGERWVRAIGCASIGAALVVLALSFAAGPVLAPIRRIAGRG